jgi:hypothetical protein
MTTSLPAPPSSTCFGLNAWLGSDVTLRVALIAKRNREQLRSQFRSSHWACGSRQGFGRNVYGSIATENRCPRQIRFPPDNDQIADITIGRRWGKSRRRERPPYVFCGPIPRQNLFAASRLLLNRAATIADDTRSKIEGFYGSCPADYWSCPLYGFIRNVKVKKFVAGLVRANVVHEHHENTPPNFRSLRHPQAPATTKKVSLPDGRLRRGPQANTLAQGGAKSLEAKAIACRAMDASSKPAVNGWIAAGRMPAPA